MVTFEIKQASSDEDINDIKVLFKAYVEWLNLDLTFQDYGTELTSLPGKYAAPLGRLLLARRQNDGKVIGCIAVRPLGESHSTKRHEMCELKRLFVTPGGRGTGVGRALVISAIQQMKHEGYSRMRLDTLVDRMAGAIRLYESLGFTEIEKYYDTPLAATKFLELDLTTHEAS